MLEAGRAINQALEKHTPEASFYYHAGMIAEAAGNKEDCRRHLQKALSLNPKFDLRQAAIAELTLRNTGN